MKLETMLAGCVVAGSLFANGTDISANTRNAAVPGVRVESCAPRVVVYPEYPAAIARDAAYAVQVEQEGVRRPLASTTTARSRSSRAGRTAET